MGLIQWLLWTLFVATSRIEIKTCRKKNVTEKTLAKSLEKSSFLFFIKFFLILDFRLHGDPKVLM